jgi:hypothetical protein
MGVAVFVDFGRETAVKAVDGAADGFGGFVGVTDRLLFDARDILHAARAREKCINNKRYT